MSCRVILHLADRDILGWHRDMCDLARTTADRGSIERLRNAPMSESPTTQENDGTGEAMERPPQMTTPRGFFSLDIPNL